MNPSPNAPHPQISKIQNNNNLKHPLSQLQKVIPNSIPKPLSKDPRIIPPRKRHRITLPIQGNRLPQKLTQRLPPILDIIDEQVLRRHNIFHVAIMRLEGFTAVGVEVVVEVVFPYLLPSWADPARSGEEEGLEDGGEGEKRVREEGRE